MTPEDHEAFKKWRHAQIRSAKRLLRPLPRKANVHRYPVLKKFKGLKEKKYLWSFRVKDVIPSLYAAWILALVPLFGFQLVLSVCFALYFRSNLPIMAGIQLTTNAFTVPPIFYVMHLIGAAVWSGLGGPAEVVTLEDMKNIMGFFSEFGVFTALIIILEMFIGGFITGGILGFVSSSIYRFMAHRIRKKTARFEELRRLNKIADGSLAPPAEL